ncbi:MAG: hypothetical protein HC865_25995 [Cyanobacteria bacterium RU_5_0]|nr:hypothetical protein [Cyanobacteria bacterium RU_5_0]
MQATPNVQQFLNLIDRLSDAVGASVPPIVNLERLRSLPSGTFGRAWADSLDRNNLTPLAGLRRKQLHDGIHVLTGYGTDPLGEAEVQAFLLGAKFRLTHIVLGLGLWRPIRRQLAHQADLTSEQARTRLWQAYQRGYQSGFDVDTWQPELLWALPLEQVQALAGLQQFSNR